ncbi:MAG: precorrin-3B C(17)-methyltransferase [Deltaproteobacteria bacterium]|nr:precorrin-3B C(17)-methyltransferase [Deltaproteobacteria bacterium]
MDKKTKDRTCDNSSSKGSICIVGIGPGGIEHLTFKAKETLENSDVVVGYKTYIDLIKRLIPNKEIFSTGMTREVDRCQKAIELALQGKKVAVVSSGDAGIYGMAGLVLELLQGAGVRGQGSEGKNKSQISNLKSQISIIPGVPAFCAAASLLGAPLMHDFASISLSDLLTPWETIKKRLEMTSISDFVTILYNPKSKTRISQLEEAIAIISSHRKENTPVGIVKNATRKKEEIKITTLKEMPSHYDFIDMTTIVIIGNSATFIANGKIITPRGYDV